MTSSEWLNLHPTLDVAEREPVWCFTQNAEGRYAYVQQRLPAPRDDETRGDLSFTANILSALGEPFLRPGDVLDNFLVRVEGGFGGKHEGLPASMPRARLVTTDLRGNVTRVIATAIDTSSDVASYDTGHRLYSPVGLGFAWSGREHVVIQLLGESSQHALAGALAVHVVKIKVVRPMSTQSRAPRALTNKESQS